MSREAGWAPKLLPSRGGLVGRKSLRLTFWNDLAMAGVGQSFYSKPGVIKWG